MFVFSVFVLFLTPTYSHVVKGNANVVWHSFAEDGNLGVALTEVVQQDELGPHALANVNSLGSGAKKVK